MKLLSRAWLEDEYGGLTITSTWLDESNRLVVDEEFSSADEAATWARWLAAVPSRLTEASKCGNL